MVDYPLGVEFRILMIKEPLQNGPGIPSKFLTLVNTVNHKLLDLSIIRKVVREVRGEQEI